MVPTNTNVTAEEPEMGTRCENNALQFNYDYRNTSCDEEYEVWSASKFIPAALRVCGCRQFPVSGTFQAILPILTNHAGPT
jgi:hypothetical protein